MTNEEVIRQLESLKDNSKSFFDPKDPDSEIWGKDIIALDIAIAALKGEKRQTLKVICGITGTVCTNCKYGPCEARRMGVPNEPTDL